MEREWHEKRWAENAARCNHCGLPRSVCSDPAARFYPQREVCYASMERDAANARYERLHSERKWHDGTGTNWSKDPSPDYPYRFDFGLTIGVAETDLRPDDDFLTRETAPLHEIPEEVSGGDSS